MSKQPKRSNDNGSYMFLWIVIAFIGALIFLIVMAGLAPNKSDAIPDYASADHTHDYSGTDHIHGLQAHYHDIAVSELPDHDHDYAGATHDHDHDHDTAHDHDTSHDHHDDYALIHPDHDQDVVLRYPNSQVVTSGDSLGVIRAVVSADYTCVQTTYIIGNTRYYTCTSPDGVVEFTVSNYGYILNGSHYDGGQRCSQSPNLYAPGSKLNSRVTHNGKELFTFGHPRIALDISTVDMFRRLVSDVEASGWLTSQFVYKEWECVQNPDTNNWEYNLIAHAYTGSLGLSTPGYGTYYQVYDNRVFNSLVYVAIEADATCDASIDFTNALTDYVELSQFTVADFDELDTDRVCFRSLEPILNLAEYQAIDKPAQ